MSHLSKLLLATLAISSSLLLGGCGTSSTGPRVAFVTNNADPFWNIAKAGAQKAEKEFGVTLLFKMPSPGNVATQKQEIEDVLKNGAKAVAISVIDPVNQADDINAFAAKVPILTQDNDAPGTKRLAYIGTDNYAAGRAVGQLVKEALGEEGGTIAIFVGDLAPLNARQRRQGVIDEILGNDAPKDLADFEKSADGLKSKDGKYQFAAKTYLDQPKGRDDAKANAEEYTGKHMPAGKVCLVGLWAYNPPMCLAAIEKLEKSKKDRISIVGFDEDPATLDGIADGTVYATVVQDPYKFGYESVKIMAALAKGDKSGIPENGLIYVPHRIIMKEAGKKNGLERLAVKPFRDELNSLLGK